MTPKALPDDLTYLAHLRLVTRRRRRGGTWGERRSTRKGMGLEFADYRDYAPGDDPRRVDWNLYARLDRLYVQLYEEEEELSVAIVLDGSGSMAWGEGANARWPVARQLATALGALALLGGDRLYGAIVQESALVAWGPRRGRGHVAAWRAWLDAQTPRGQVAMGEALRTLALRLSHPALILLCTDGYDPEGLAEGITALAGGGHEVVLLHLLTPDELAPPLHGDLRLVDVESGDKREITLDRATLAAYRQRLEAWQVSLRAMVGRHGGRYAFLSTALPTRRLILEELRRAHVVR